MTGFVPYRHFVPLPPKEEVKLHVILNDSEGSHRRTDEAYTLLTLVVGYFACAQYDVLRSGGLSRLRLAMTGFVPYRHFVPLPPKEEAKLHVILNDSEESHNLSEEYMLHTFSVGYFAALNMT